MNVTGGEYGSSKKNTRNGNMQIFSQTATNGMVGGLGVINDATSGGIFSSHKFNESHFEESNIV